MTLSLLSLDALDVLEHVEHVYSCPTLCLDGLDRLLSKRKERTQKLIRGPDGAFIALYYVALFCNLVQFI